MTQTPTEYDWAWLAGFIDGEGCFNIRQQHGTSKRTGAYKKRTGTAEEWTYHTARLGVNNTHLLSMEKAAAMLQGNVTCRPAKPGLVPVYSIEVGARKKLEVALPKLLPYLVTKAEQARIMLDFLALPRDAKEAKSELCSLIADAKRQ